MAAPRGTPTDADLSDLEDFQETARVLRCLGHPVRLRILGLLSQRGPLTVKEIYEQLGLGQAVCSQHLSKMRDHGILSHRREGVHTFYDIGNERAVRVLSCLRCT